MKIYGNLVDIFKRDIYKACITVESGMIRDIKSSDSGSDIYILPGLIDSHIHVESSMITPSAFAKKAVKYGTIGVVSDPHEIANVCGIKGIDFMIRDALKVPVKFCFGSPSCVPATDYETNGAVISKHDTELLLRRDDIGYLSEMMNYPGVIYDDQDVLFKINTAKRLGKPVDGHAPGLKGILLEKYVSAGISTDHECSTLEEALEKISHGMKILIREGSAAKNLDALKSLYNTHSEYLMLCSDDLHPEMLLKGHINLLIARLITAGYNLFDVLRSATINPVNHYKINAGLIRKGDPADFILVDNLNKMSVVETWIDGVPVYKDGKTLFSSDRPETINNFNCSLIKRDDISIENRGTKIRIIKASDGELLTQEFISSAVMGDFVMADIERDHLKIVVKDRYNDSLPVAGFIKGFNLKRGAFAGSIAHDSHNIISVGTNDEDITSAVNAIISMKGGIAVSCHGEINCFQLNIGGIMTSGSCEEAAGEYEKLSNLVKAMGCNMAAPFMTLAFMALLVIPDLKIGDRGLFDVTKFKPVSLFVDS